MQSTDLIYERPLNEITTENMQKRSRQKSVFKALFWSMEICEQTQKRKNLSDRLQKRIFMCAAV